MKRYEKILDFSGDLSYGVLLKLVPLVAAPEEGEGSLVSMHIGVHCYIKEGGVTVYLTPEEADKLARVLKSMSRRAKEFNRLKIIERNAFTEFTEDLE